MNPNQLQYKLHENYKTFLVFKFRNEFQVEVELNAEWVGFQRDRQTDESTEMKKKVN